MNTAPASRVTIVVVSYNVCALLRQCLSSAVAAKPPAQVIVVDNASHDGSVEMVRREFPTVMLIANKRNRGFAAGTNQGLCHALAADLPSDYVLLLNPDAFLRRGALAAMVEFMDEHPRVGAVGARLFYPDGRPQEGAWHFPTLWMTLLDLFPPRGPLLGRLYASSLNGRYREERGSDPFPIDHPLGAAMLLRRTTLEQVGLLDEGYWMYVEEVDWCYRCRQAGWAIWQVPSAEVVHVAGASSQQFKGRSFVALHRSRLRFFAKLGSPRRERWNRRIVRAGMLWAALSAWRDRLRGRIGVEELRSRLLAYGQVLRLARGDD
ncbi:MAG TPA: glycosyltransferase family 2 protein [Herpetosiphonaceae bacterium]